MADFRARLHRRNDRAELSVLAMRSTRVARSTGNDARLARMSAGRWSGSARMRSTTPKTTLRKLGADAVVLGECEDILPQLAGPWWQVAVDLLPGEWRALVQGGTHASRHDCAPGAALARCVRPSTRAPSPPLRSAAAGTRRGSGNVARLPLPLHVLRKGQFSRQISPPACRDRPRGSGRPDRARRRIHLLHRRDLSARTKNCSKGLAQRT